MNAWKRITLAGLSLLVLGLAPIGAAFAQVKVTAATPASAYQGTIALDVVVSGSGFNNTAKVQYFVTGTTNPGGITVRSVRFNNSRELVTTIDVADTAVLTYFDIQVTLDSGRKGKGTTLFSVKSRSTGTDSYYSQNLGTLPGDKYSDAWDVNAAGNVVGRSYTGVVKAFYWAGAMYQLPESVAARNSPPSTVAWNVEATGISNGPGEIAVGYEERTICESGGGTCSLEQYPVIWTGDLSKTPAAVRLDGARGVAFGVNPAASIAVGSGGGQAGAFWKREGDSWVRSNVSLSAFVCGACEYDAGGAWNVNDTGIIVGFVSRKSDYLQFAYVYDTGTAIGTVLPIPAGYFHSNAYSISNVVDGSVHVAGVVSPCMDDATPCDTNRGIQWTVDIVSLQVSFEILDQMAWAEGVTDRGAVAGTHNSERNRRGATTQTAVLWNQQSGYVSLKPTSGSDSTSRGMAAGSNGITFVVGEVNARGSWTAARWVIP
jgi:hypothetical protein